MEELTTPPLQKRKRRKTPLPPPDMGAHRRNARKASDKLKSGERLSDEELISLFKADYIENEKLEKVISLYGQDESLKLFAGFDWSRKKRLVEIQSRIICLNIELELIEYFKKHPEQLYTISPRKFEEFVAAVFRNHGFEVQLTPETRDGGMDIIAVHKSPLTGSTVSLIECKRYTPDNKVGIGVVQRLLGNVIQQEAHKGVVVTTSFFTRDAIAVSKQSRNILTLSDYSSIMSWLTSV
ncbi:restriction endonuclease [Thiocystis violascens]|uniref:Restriction endonuclease n=1 Tax=Thiocystis violascens (strain ATCC 17096 / DSM 198 / 6111) TaxID=765911 RepID=I3YFC7_THIV6|nr:restriction endonuclease [Thiocystis violascens]AFL75695.1 restriction endonuclease [Thiocystis violascens DSM 198]